MPCGCKKGSGMYIRGGGFKKKRRKKKGSGLDLRKLGKWGAASAARGGYGDMRGWVEAQKARWGGRARVRAASLAAANRFVGTKTGSGRARFLPGVTWHRGSGMNFSGAGMNFSGSGLRGKRMLYRRGSGRRMV
jgi:hypothetical protein